MVVAAVGPFVGNYDSADNAPAHTAVIDYFFNMESPIVPEDGGPVPESEQNLVVTVTGSGTVIVDPDQETYGCGDVVTLTAEPAEDWVFTGWSGDLTGSDNPATITMDFNKTVTAEFEPISGPQYTLTMAVSGNGSTTPSVGDHNYAEGEVITISAVPDSGWQFDIWTGDVADPYSASTTVNMDTDKTVTATFFQDSGIVSDDFNACTLDPMWILEVDLLSDATVSMQGAGTENAQLLFSVPAGLSHNAWNDNTAPWLLQSANNTDFMVEVKFDSALEQGFQNQGIIVQQDSGNWLRFDFYSDGTEMLVFAATTVNNSSTLVVNESISPGSPPMYLRVERAGDVWTQWYSYDGTAWIEVVSFIHEMVVAAVGPFVGNYDSADNAPAHTAVIDYFFNMESPIVPEDGGPVPESEQNLVVTVTGSGTVIVDPDQETYGCGDVVTLTAEPAEDWVFTGWSGDLTGSDNPATITMDFNKTVTAEFEPISGPQYTLTIAVSGNGSTTPPVGDHNYAEGEIITVSAESNGGWQFDIWTGDVADPDSATTTVYMDTDKIVTATFTESDVIYTENFEDYLAGADPVDWLDTEANNSMQINDSLFNVFDLNGNNVFGTTSTLTDIHSHYLNANIDTLFSYEYTGRMRVTSADSDIGVTFFSQYPDTDAYYSLLRHTDNSFHIASHGTSMTGGTTDTGLVPLHDVWYRFIILVVDTGTRTVIRAKVWQDGTAEPLVWQVDAYDDSATRLTFGTIGVWSSTSGIKYWDDLVVDYWSPGSDGPIIDIWYGLEQRFGHIGIPQRWVNILGNVLDFDGVEFLTYWLNDGPELPLNIGPTDYRLADEGDFNIEIAIEDLEVWPNQNQVVIRAIDIYGNETFETIIVNYEGGNVWPENYTIDWSSVSSIQDVAQIVDGLWSLGTDSIQAEQLAYDRLVAVGDVSWENYEVTVPITVYGIEETYGPPGGGPTLGFVVRWLGHEDDGNQPSVQWWPVGIVGAYLWRQDYERFVLVDNYYRVEDIGGLQLQFDVEYIFKLRAETNSNYSVYSLKVWLADQSEPADWTLIASESVSTDQTVGSVLLVSQFVEASFGNVTIVSLD